MGGIYELIWRESCNFFLINAFGFLRLVPAPMRIFAKFPQRSAAYYVLLNDFSYMYGVVFQRAVCVVFQRKCKRPCVVFQRKINR